ncbi:hypothetical protein [Aureispira anguillae]|uniref:Uncharacterized protein n=1 Tax=Aureispira anguillae TaxID=2864201 RepID=A0A915YEV5_9BACT|nr:hypothetical protein [Aureispira anguillae]BDS11749.1 hypothetical protein AsAng_0024630 [Aureispira anguillae]
MKYLLEISKIVTKKKVKKIEIFDDHSLKQKNSKFNDFYGLLMDGALKDDQEAATKLYNSNPTDDKYRQLKSRFKKRLLNTLFFLDVNQSATSNYNRAYYCCHKDWTLVKILLSNNAQQTGAQLARSIISIALKFDFADIVVNAARILREHAMLEKNEKLYEEYNNLCQQYQIILTAEIESEEYYQRIVMNSLKSASKLQPFIPQFEKYCARLLELSQLHSSPVIVYNYYIVSAHYYEMQNDYQNLYKICQQAEQYIEENPRFYREDKLAEIASKKMLALLHLQDFAQGEIEAEKYLTIFERNDVCMKLMEYYLLLALHTQNYSKAHRIFGRAYEDKRFKKLTSDEKEKWNAFEVYLCFLLWNNPEQSFERPKRYKQFRVKRFLEEPVIFPKNQRIFTVLLVIGQVLFLLKEERLGEAFERIERLKGYSNRLLKQEEHYRVTQFVRLLQQLAKAHFDYKNIGVHQKYLDRLENKSLKYRGLIHELEIIPYQNLWAIILKTINSKTMFRS